MCHMDVSAHADSGLLALASYTFPVKTEEKSISVNK